MRMLNCTLCGAELPVPEVTLTGSAVEALTLDDSYVNEHVEMHTTCTCEWGGDTGHMVMEESDVDCPHHGVTPRHTASTSNSALFPDLLTDEDVE